MKGRKLALAMAAFALVAVVVGVFVWPEPKEAKADTYYYSVDAWCVPDWCAAGYAEIQIRFKFNDIWGDWTDAWVVDGAHYFLTTNLICDQWQIRLAATSEYADDEDPITVNGGTFSYGTWNLDEHNGEHP